MSYINNGYRYLSGDRAEHRVKVEMAIGKSLLSKNQVHHIDNDKLNNENNNLIACEDQSYHRLLHTRQHAFNMCGNPDYRKCHYCGLYDDPNKMYKHPSNRGRWHRACRNNFNRGDI